MKCVRSNTDSSIKRVRDDMAVDMVTGGKWKFCSKKEWKDEVRSKVIVVETVAVMPSEEASIADIQRKLAREEKKRIANEKRKARTGN